jgi:outer membrane immunogenic protein
MKKLIKLSATPALVAGMTALTVGTVGAQSLFDDMNFYVGATGGVMSWEANHRFDPGNGSGFDTDDTLGILSALAGITTHTEDGWLFGIEGDIGLPLGGDLDDEDIDPGNQWSDMNYDAHVRARVGRRFGGADVFLAGGLAIIELEQDVDGANSNTHTLTGFTVGGGVDWAFTDSLIARVELLYDEYGREETFGNDYSGDWSDTTVRGGLLFQF